MAEFKRSSSPLSITFIVCIFYAGALYKTGGMLNPPPAGSEMFLSLLAFLEALTTLFIELFVGFICVELYTE